MAMICKNSVSECTGCMMCQEAPKPMYRCDCCGNDICDGEEYVRLSFGGISYAICSDCISDNKFHAGEDDWL